MWSRDAPELSVALSPSPSPATLHSHSPTRSNERRSRDSQHRHSRDKSPDKSQGQGHGQGQSPSQSQSPGHSPILDLQGPPLPSASDASTNLDVLDARDPDPSKPSPEASRGCCQEKRCVVGVAGAIGSLVITGFAWLFVARPSTIQPVKQMMQDLLPGGNLSLPSTVGVPVAIPSGQNSRMSPPPRWECDYQVEGWALSTQSGLLQGSSRANTSDDCRSLCVSSSNCSVWMWYREAGSEPPGPCAQVGCRSYNKSRPCQCNAQCLEHDDCCSDAIEQCGPNRRSNRSASTSTTSSSSTSSPLEAELQLGQDQGSCSLMALKQHEAPIATRYSSVVSGALPCNMARFQAPGSLFCFAVVVPRSYELGLLKLQWKLGASLFACEGFTLYSNESFDAAPGVLTSVVNTTLQCQMGGEFGTWLNTDIFIKVWKKLVSDADFLAYDWTVKVDADTVFLPQVLRSLLAHHAPALKDADSPAGTGRGLYLTNCDLGLHGPIEVLSQRAVSVWVVGTERCREHFTRLCSGDCLWGEDLFMDQCLSKVLGARRDNEFNLLSEAHCKAPNASRKSPDAKASSGGYLALSAERNWSACDDFRAAFHPFKDAQSYRVCLDRAEAFAKSHGLERSVAVPRLQLYQGGADEVTWADSASGSGIAPMNGNARERGAYSLREAPVDSSDDGSAGVWGQWISAPLFMLVPMLCSFLWSRRSTARCASARPTQHYEWRYSPLSLECESPDLFEEPL